MNHDNAAGLTWLESKDFYELCQNYRHAQDIAPRAPGMDSAVEAFERLKLAIADAFVPTDADSESVHGWTPVAAGQLPRGDDDVLAATTTGHVIPAHPTRIRQYHAEAQQNGEDCFYTHWMTMPKGPSNAER